jgi:hypothetical protein
MQLISLSPKAIWLARVLNLILSITAVSEYLTKNNQNKKKLWSSGSFRPPRRIAIFHVSKLQSHLTTVYVKQWAKYRSLSCTSSESTCELWEGDTSGLFYEIIWSRYGLGFFTKFLTHNMFWLFLTLNLMNL